MAEPKPSRLRVFLLAVAVVIAGAVGGGVLYYENHKLGTPHELTVQAGGNATVNYIGLFGSGPQIGRVFDTNLWSVYTNNGSWPKALQYSPHGTSPSNYTPIGFFVGSTAPSGGYTIGNLTFETPVTGFWQGLIGMAGNQTRYLTLPPSLAYGSANQSCYVTKPLSYTLPVTVSLTRSAFSSQFPNVTALAGIEYTDPVYKWTDLVLSVNASSVVYQNLPSLGTKTAPEGWPVLVTNVTATTITLTNQLTAANAGLVGGKSAASVCSTTSFIVSSVNQGASTYVEDYNSEVVGQTLVFIVTTVDIFPPGFS